MMEGDLTGQLLGVWYGTLNADVPHQRTVDPMN